MPENRDTFKKIFPRLGQPKPHRKRAFVSKLWVIIPFLLFSSNLLTNSILISPIIDDGSSLVNWLEVYTIPGAEADAPIDFVIKEAEEVTVQDQVLEPSGDIVVERDAKLILRNATVLFTHAGCFEHGIVLGENTTLDIYHSQIRGRSNLFFFKAQDTNLIIEDSKIRMTHVLCGNSSRISIVRSDLWALHCFNESTADIVNAQLHYLFLRGNSSAQVEDSHIVEVLLYGSSRASISDTTLKNIFYFDEALATLSNCSYVDLIRFRPKLCDLTVTVLDNETHYPVPMVNITLDRPKGCEIATSSTDNDGIATFHDLEEGDYFAEVEMEGYVPAKARIPLLNETQHETLMICRIELADERYQTLTNRFFPTLTSTVLAALALYLFYRAHMRGEKSAEGWH